MVSQPPLEPTPSCLGSSTSRNCSPSLVAAILDTSLRRVSPTAIGRRPPDVLGSAARLAPQTNGLMDSGISPLAIRLATSASCLPSSSTHPGLAAAWMWDGRIPVQPPADAVGKSFSAFMQSSPVKVIALAGEAGGKAAIRSFEETEARGCFFCRALAAAWSGSTGGGPP